MGLDKELEMLAVPPNMAIRKAKLAHWIRHYKLSIEAVELIMDLNTDNLDRMFEFYSTEKTEGESTSRSLRGWIRGKLWHTGNDEANWGLRWWQDAYATERPGKSEVEMVHHLVRDGIPVRVTDSAGRRRGQDRFGTPADRQGGLDAAAVVDVGGHEAGLEQA